jgi:hypothetical protein
MDPSNQAKRPTPIIGLCESCQSVRRTINARGSVFFLCEAHKTHSEMPKYPTVPVVSCGVYEQDTNGRG